jgi:DNA-binding transcriptional LysR family regulator
MALRSVSRPNASFQASIKADIRWTIALIFRQYVTKSNVSMSYGGSFLANLRDRLPPLSSIVAFEAAARFGSFTKAAASLNVTPAAISKQITRLEGLLGVELFRPSGRGRVLTHDGKELFEAVTIGLEHVAAAVSKIKQHNTSKHLTIGTTLAFASSWLIPRIASFRREYPQIELRVVTTDRDLDPTEENISLAVRYGDGKWPNLKVTPLIRPHVFPVCSPGFLRGCGQLNSIEDALQQCTLLDRDSEGSFGITWDAWLSRSNIASKKRLNRICFNSYEITVRAALAGQGLALGVDVLVEDLIQQKLLMRPLPNDLAWPEAYYMVSPAREQPSFEVNQFSQWILEEAGNKLAPSAH